MPIEVSCDSCSNSYRVKDDRAGTTIKCKVCGSRIKVPAEDEEEEDLPVSTRRPSGKPGRKGSKRGRSSKGGNQQALLIAGVGGVSILVVVGLLVLLLTRSGKAPGGADVADGGQAAAVGGSGNSDWQVQVDPPTSAIAWPDEVNLTIPIPGPGDPLCVPSTHSPFVSLGYSAYESDGAQMWNLASGKQVGAISGKPSQANMRSVSPDGKYLAIKVLDRAQKCVFEVWSFETGKLFRTITDDQSPSVGMMDFGPNNQLCYYATGPARLGARVKLWDIDQGKLVREVPIKGAHNSKCHAFSPGRRYVVIANHADRITVIDLAAGKIAGSVQLPKSSELTPFFTPQAVCLGPDGARISVLLDSLTETRIVKIDVQTGQYDSKKDFAFPGWLLGSIHAAASYKGPPLECLPNGAYLVAGSMLIDGESGRMVWQLDYGPRHFDFEKRIPVPNGLVGTEGTREGKRLVVLDIPWNEITASLKALAAGQTAAVKPGQPVSLEIKVGTLQHGTSEETAQALSEALTRRLAAVGIEVKPGQAAVLSVSYQEAAGKNLQESVHDLNNPLNKATTGRSVQTTRAELAVSWLRDKTAAPIWSKTIKVNPSVLVVQGEITPEKARAKMFEDLNNTLLSQPIPYFIPDDQKLAQLPGVTSVGDH